MLNDKQLEQNGTAFLMWKKIALEGVDASQGDVAPMASPEELAAGDNIPAEELAAAPPNPEEEAATADNSAALSRVMTGLISHELRLQLAYLFYAETMRGIGRGELAELFHRHASSEVKDASYLMRRLSIMVPGGAIIPPPPSPEPKTDPADILATLHELELSAITYLKSLHALVGDDPMSYTLEAMMSEEQGHADALEQHFAVESQPAATAIPESTQDAPPEEPAAAAVEATAPPGSKVAEEVAERDAMAQAMNEPVEAFLLRTQAQQIQQKDQELAAARQELSGAQEQAMTASMQAEQGQATVQQLQGELESHQMAAQEAQATATQATEQAAMAEENAAQQAVAKMNLSIRVQQMRQSLADMASSDPVAEEGLGFGTQAGPGTPQTAMQQQAAQQQAMAMDPTGGTGAAPTEEAAQQQEEAATAQQHAQQQTAQAQEKTVSDTKDSGGKGKSEGKPGTTVSVKTSGIQRALRSAGRSAALHGPHMLAGAGVGAGLGAAAGAATSDPGERMSGARRGALMGAGVGAVGGGLVGRDALLAAEHRGTAEIARVRAAQDLASAERDVANGMTGNGMRSSAADWSRSATELDSAARTHKQRAAGVGLGAGAGSATAGALMGKKTHEADKSAGMVDAARSGVAAVGHDAGYGAMRGISRAAQEAMANHGKAIRTAVGVGGVVTGGALAANAVRRNHRENRMIDAVERLANNSDYERINRGAR